MSQIQTSLWYRLRRPLAINVLGLLPFWLFLGTSQQLTVNSKLEQSSSFNVLGLILAVAGLAMLVKMLRKDGSYGECERWWPRTVLGLLGAVLCVFQIGQAAGLYKVDAAQSLGQWQASLLGPAEPKLQSTASGLDSRTADVIKQRSAVVNQLNLRDDIATTVARIHANAALYNRYAEACNIAGKRFVADPVPAMLNDDDRAYIAKGSEKTGRNLQAEVNCSAPAVRELITKWVADDIWRDRAALAAQTAAYQKRFGGQAPAELPPSLKTVGLPIWLGDSVAEVQRAFGTEQPPVPDRHSGKPAMSFPEKGVDVAFNQAGQVRYIAVRPPFNGRIVGLHLGDSRRTVNRLIGGSLVEEYLPVDDGWAEQSIQSRQPNPPVLAQWVDRRSDSPEAILMLTGPIYGSSVESIQLFAPDAQR